MGTCKSSTVVEDNQFIEGGITAIQVLQHNSQYDSWVIVNEKVYNFSNYLGQNPTIKLLIMQYSGKDGSVAFNTQNDAEAKVEIEQYFQGVYIKPLINEEEFIKLIKLKNEQNNQLSEMVGNDELYFNNDIEEAQVHSMFCNQCELALNKQACTTFGVCGKSPLTSALQDLLLHYLKGISQYCQRLTITEIPLVILQFVLKNTYATSSNLNYLDQYFYEQLKMADSYRNLLEQKFLAKQQQKMPQGLSDSPAQFVYKNSHSYLIAQAKQVGIKERKFNFDNESVFAFIEFLQYGIKGISAYFTNCEEIHDNFPNVYSIEERNKLYRDYFKLYQAIAESSFHETETLFEAILDMANLQVNVLRTLDTCISYSFGISKPVDINFSYQIGKCILVSGGDLLSLYHALQFTIGTGINIYTHGAELLVAHSKTNFKKFNNLIGHYGGHWHQQTTDFANFPGPIICNSNSLLPPLSSYKNRLFTTNQCYYPGIHHINQFNFSKVISVALGMNGFTEDNIQNIVNNYQNYKEKVGHSHQSVCSFADKIIQYYKSGEIKYIYVIGGGDSPNQNQYCRAAAKKASRDSLIFTFGSQSQNLFGLELGKIHDIPRVLNLGQTNDIYSMIVIAQDIAQALSKQVKDLPILVLYSWFDQKDIANCLALLHSGFINFRIGPNMPAFMSKNIMERLQNKFSLKLQGTVEEDVKAFESQFKHKQ